MNAVWYIKAVSKRQAKWKWELFRGVYCCGDLWKESGRLWKKEMQGSAKMKGAFKYESYTKSISDVPKIENIKMCVMNEF